MDSLKEWAIKLGVQEFGPSAIRGAILGAFGYALARGGALAAYGIAFDAATHTIIVHCDQLSTATIALLPALIAAIVKGTQYHGTSVVKSLTQGESNP